MRGHWFNVALMALIVAGLFWADANRETYESHMAERYRR